MSKPAHPPGGINTPPPTWAERRDAAGDAATRLHQSWSWLALLVEPGPETSAGRVLSDIERDRQAADLRVERYERTKVGASAAALAPSPAPIRLAVVDLQAYLTHRVRRVASRCARAAVPVGYRPAGAAVPQLLDWLTVGRPPAPWIGSATGVLERRCAFDRCPAGTLSWAAEQLRHADQLARVAAGVFTDRLAPLPDRCPVCRLRSLQLDYTSDQRNSWSVVCTSTRCVCSGTGCPCRHRIRYEGRRHAWSYGELDGPYGLWAAIGAARLPRPPIRRTASGHGAGPLMRIVADREGVRWADTDTVLAQVQVDRKLLNKWVERGLVDEPRRAGGLWWYPLDQCIDVEWGTLDSGRSTRTT